MLFLSIYLVRIVGLEVFGKWGVVRSTSSVFTVLLGFGIGVSALRFVSEFYKKDKIRVGGVIGVSVLFSVIMGLFLTALFFFTSSIIANKFLKDGLIINELKISSFFLFFIAINGIFSGVISGLKEYKFIALTNILACIISAPIIVYLSINFELEGIVKGYLSYYFILSIFYFYFFLKMLRKYELKVRFSDYRQNMPILFSHNLPAVLSGGIGGITTWLVTIFVARLDDGYKIIGVNNAAKIIQNSIMELAAQLDLPMLSYLTSTKDKIAEKLNQFTPLLFALLFVAPIIWIPDMVNLLFNNSQFDGERFLLVVSLVMFTVFVMIFKRGLGRSIISKDLLWWGVYENIIWSILLFLMIYYFVAPFKSVGYALAFSLAYFFDYLIILPIYFKKGLVLGKLSYSNDMFIIWIFIISGVLINYIELHLIYKIINFIIFYPVILMVLYRMYKSLK